MADPSEADNPMQTTSPKPLLTLDRPPGYKRRHLTPIQHTTIDVGTTSSIRRITPLPSVVAIQRCAFPRAVAAIPDVDNVMRDIRAYDGQGRATEERVVDGVRYYINAFWPPNGGGSHALQKGPYHACFSGNLAAFVIGRFSSIGATVHDPHLGRGTTAIQSALMGRVAFGSDINPVSLMMARPRLAPIALDDITARLDALDLAPGRVENEDLLAFFHPSTLQELEAMRRILATNAQLEGDNPDRVLDWIRMAILFRITGHTPAYLSRQTVPPNQPTPTLSEQRRRNQRTGLPAPERDLRKIVLSRSRDFLRDGCVPDTQGHRLTVGPAWDTPWIANASVDLVLTSPPFADVVDYKRDNWLRAWFARVDLGDVAFSNHRSLPDWSAMIRRTLKEQMRIVRPGGYIAMEVGEIHKGTVHLERLVWSAAKGLPCHRIGVIMNQQDFTKSAHTAGITNGKRGTNSNRIVVLQRI